MPADETSKLTKGFAFVEYLQPEVGSCLAALQSTGCKLLPPSPLLSTPASIVAGLPCDPSSQLVAKGISPGQRFGRETHASTCMLRDCIQFGSSLRISAACIDCPHGCLLASLQRAHATSKLLPRSLCL